MSYSRSAGLVVIALLLTAASAPVTAQQMVVPLKVDVVLSRWQGEKRISNMPFTLFVNTGGNTSVRLGVDVPVGNSVVTSGRQTPTSRSDVAAGSQTTTETLARTEYRNVGTAIDCRAGLDPDGRYSIYLNVQDSSIFTTDGESKPSLKMVDPLAFRTFSMSNTLYMRDGQSRQFGVATDKITGEQLRVEVTLSLVK
jgi:hypothetical protein